jgi:hypothetical protein
LWGSGVEKSPGLNLQAFALFTFGRACLLLFTLARGSNIIHNMATKSFHRLQIQEIYSALDTLKDSGWHSEVVYSPKELWKGKEISFPIRAYYTKKKGSALWIISGIHGEEPAGPCAIAKSIDVIKKLGEEIPIVLLPLCNPHGYYKNFRYPNQKKWAEHEQNQSVGDSEFYLPDFIKPSKPRANKPSCPESRALISKVLELAKKYPTVVSVDLHEDNLLNAGYVYYYGTDYGLMKKVSVYVLNILDKNSIKINMGGITRFNEPIVNGAVINSPLSANMPKDGSTDELLSSKKIIVNSRVVRGPSSKVSVVVETPAKSLPLNARINAHSAVIRSLGRISKLAGLF